MQRLLEENQVDLARRKRLIEDFEKEDHYWIPEGMIWNYTKPIEWLWFLIKFEDDINFIEQSNNNDQWDDMRHHSVDYDNVSEGDKIGWVREDVLQSYQ